MRFLSSAYGPVYEPVVVAAGPGASRPGFPGTGAARLAPASTGGRR